MTQPPKQNSNQTASSHLHEGVRKLSECISRFNHAIVPNCDTLGEISGNELTESITTMIRYPALGIVADVKKLYELSKEAHAFSKINQKPDKLLPLLEVMDEQAKKLKNAIKHQLLGNADTLQALQCKQVSDEDWHKQVDTTIKMLVRKEIGRLNQYASCIKDAREKVKKG